MSSNNRPTEVSVFRSGYLFALILLAICGFLLVVIGAGYPQGSLRNVVLIGSGIAMGPAAIVGILFRVFLFKEVQYQLTQPIMREVKERLGPEIRDEVRNIVGEYRKEIAALQALQEAGVLCAYRRREAALRDFASAIDAETSEIMIIGSSLKGFLQDDKYKMITDKLRFKMSSDSVRVKFLLTHPAVADLRAGQEARQFTYIGKEIIASLRVLKDWGVPIQCVRLYKGTPTIFAIKAGRKMLLNPYPYGAVAYDSPCLIVETSDTHASYFYDAFDASHFGAWDSSAVESISDYDNTIQELANKLDEYARTVSEMLKL